MKIGISSPAFSVVDFETMLPRIAPHFEVWELIGEYKHYLPAIKEKVDALAPSYDVSFQLHLPFSDVNIASVIHRARDPALEMTLGSIDAAAELGITTATLHPGLLSSLNMKNRKWGLDIARRSVEKIYDVAKDRGVRVSLENQPYKWMLGTTLEELEFLSRDFDKETWGYCYDIGHAFLTGQGEAFSGVTGDITNIHAHDNRGEDDLHLLPGEGDVDFPAIAKTMEGARTDAVIYEANSLEEGIRGKGYLTKLFGSI